MLSYKYWEGKDSEILKANLSFLPWVYSASISRDSSEYKVIVLSCWKNSKVQWMMFSWLSFSTWAEETINSHWHALFWLANSVWKYQLLKKQNRNKQDNFDILYMPSYLYAESNTRFCQFKWNCECKRVVKSINNNSS